MKLTITNSEFFNGKILIYGITEIGNIKGIWKNNIAPVNHKEYSVELTITEYYKKISHISDKYCDMKVSLENNIVHFDGYCEDIDDEVYYIRLNTDWLEMVDIVDDCAKVKKGDFVSFSARCDCILIYPY